MREIVFLQVTRVTKALWLLGLGQTEAESSCVRMLLLYTGKWGQGRPVTARSFVAFLFPFFFFYAHLPAISYLPSETITASITVPWAGWGEDKRLRLPASPGSSEAASLGVLVSRQEFSHPCGTGSLQAQVG